MADMVARKLSKKRTVIDDAEDEEDPIIQAHLSSDTYYVALDGTVLFDASMSFSLGQEITEYWWKIDGGEFRESDGPSMQYEFYFPQQSQVTLRVVDDVGNTAETTVQVVTYEGEYDENVMSAPDGTATYSNGEIAMNWQENWPEEAEYILVRVNDVDLDFVPVSELNTIIDEIEDVADVKLEVAWLKNDYEVGEWGEILITYEEAIDEPVEEPVPTGVNLINTSLFVGMVVMIVVAIWWEQKYLPR